MIIRSDKATKEVIDAAKNEVIVRAGPVMIISTCRLGTDHGVVAVNIGQNSNAVAELWYSVWLFIWLVISITVRNPGMN